MVLNWGDLPGDVLVVIVSKLSFIDIQNMKGLCSSWHLAAKPTFSKPLPMLAIIAEPRPNHNEKPKISNDVAYNRPYILRPKTPGCVQQCNDHILIGSSSDGSLILLDKKFDPYLLHWLSRLRILLPCKNTLPFHGLGCQQPGPYVGQAILKGNPSSENEFTVIMIYEYPPNHFNEYKRIAFWRHGDIKWTDLQGINYHDIVLCNNTLYALNIGIGRDVIPTIETWDFSGNVPEKKMSIKLRFRQVGFYMKRLAKLSSTDEVLIVMWKDGLARSRRYWLILKVDTIRGRCEKVKSLNGQALFMGDTTNSVSVSCPDVEYHGFKPNSIYFVDSNNFLEDSRASYASSRGITLKMYNLEDERTHQLWTCNSVCWWRLRLAAIWVVNL